MNPSSPGKWLIFLLVLSLASACARRIPVRPVPPAEAPQPRHEPETLEPAPGQVAPTGFSIQVGAFRKLDNAVRMSATLRQFDLNVYYYASAKGLYKVRFGDFGSREEARRQAELAQRVGYIQDYYIISPQSYTFNRLSRTWPTDMQRELVDRAKSYLGLPYRWGGASRENGFDCSGLTMAVYKLSGLSLPRTSREQYRFGEPVAKTDLQPGDLIFFRNGKGGGINHVGIFIGEGRFIHAPGRNKVIRRENLSTAYFQRRFAGARRYF